MTQLYTDLKALCGLRGISGQEGEVRAYLKEEIGKLSGVRMEETALGGLLVYKTGRARAKTRVLIDAHMDEVGFVVTHLSNEGLLAFSTVGGIDPRVVAGDSVWVGSDGRKVPGAVILPPVHLTDRADRQKTIPYEKLWIDIGAENKEEAQKAVHPGDMVTFATTLTENSESLFGRALDDRAGCALLLNLLRDEDWAFDTVFSFSTQEETGGAGAKTNGFAADPQAAIVVESTTAGDMAGVDEDRLVCRQGKGPVLSFMDHGTIYDRTYCRWAFEEAERLGVPCQWKEAVAGGNNAGSLHVTRAGVRSVAVSLPCRYIHAPMGLLRKADFEAALPLLKALCARIAQAAPDET